MKKLSYFLFSFMALGLWSCQSDVDPLYQEADLLGSHSGMWTELTYGGAKVENPSVEILDSTNIKSEMLGFEGFELDPNYKYAVLPGIKVPYGKREYDFIKYTKKFDKLEDFFLLPVIIPIQINQSRDEITFEGSVSLLKSESHGTEYRIKGRLGQNSKKVTVLSAEFSQHSVFPSLVGKTFELKLDKTGFYPAFNLWTNENFPGELSGNRALCAEYFDILRNNFINNTGADAIRFTFNEDGSVNAELHMKDTDKYDEFESSKFFIGNFNEIIIIQDKDFAYQINKNFATPGSYIPTDGYLHWCFYGSNTVIALRYYIRDNELLFYPEPKYTIIPSEAIQLSTGFLYTWYNNLSDTRDNEIARILLKEIKNRNFYFTPVFKAQPVNP